MEIVNKFIFCTNNNGQIYDIELYYSENFRKINEIIINNNNVNAICVGMRCASTKEMQCCTILCKLFESMAYTQVYVMQNQGINIHLIRAVCNQKRAAI